MTDAERDEMLIRLDERMNLLITRDGIGGIIPEVKAHVIRLNGSVASALHNADKANEKANWIIGAGAAIVLSIVGVLAEVFLRLR